MTEYSRNISLFTSIDNRLNVKKLQNEVWCDSSISALFLGVKLIGSDVVFMFNDNISSAEEAAIDAIIAAHNEAEPVVDELEQKRVQAKKIIDEAASLSTGRYISEGIGQDLRYQKKEENCRAFQAAGNPEVDLNQFPWVESEKNAQNHENGATAAATILGVADAWASIGATIEEIRIGYKAQISVETDTAVIDALANKAKALLDAV